MEQLELLYKRRKKDLVRFARSRLRNVDTAEELVHDAFVKALERPAKHGNPVRTYTFLRAIVRTLCSDRNKWGHDAQEQVEYPNDKDPETKPGKAPAGGGHRILPKPTS